MDHLQHILQLIHELLSDQPYELSARLKQRLNIALIERSMPPLDQNSYGCKKFSEFLLTHMGDRIEITRPEVSGDIRIALKRDHARAKASSVEAKPKQDRAILMRSDVWQAFTNPDSKRKRYFDKVSHKILHFLDEGDEEYKAKVAERPHDFIEIEWITAGQQIAWMVEFLDLFNPSGAERAPLQQLIEAPYSSKVNAAFTKALGHREQEWRQMRTLKIAQWIQAWAVKHDVKPEELNLPATPAASCPPQPSDVKPTVMTSREQALRLLERMSDEDIAQYAIPVLLSSVLSKSQL